jgi:hypothetical protein
VLCAGRALHLALTVPLVRLAKREAALVAVVAPDQRQSRHTLSFVKGYIEALASLLKYEATLDVVTITRPDGRKVTIEARPATSGGKAVRGPSLAGVVLDEAAFFYGEGFEVSDVEIYRAARPRMEPGSQIVIASTPWAQSGLLWEHFKESYGHPKRAVVARAPTLVMRSNEPQMVEIVAAERRADSENASREYDAEFLSSDAERFFPEPLIDRCVDDALSPQPDGSIARILPDGNVLDRVFPGQKVRPGADFGFDHDASALMAFVERPNPGDKPNMPAKPTVFDLCEMGEDRPDPGMHLVPGEVIAKYAEQVRRIGGRLVCADIHYRRSIEEELTKHELALVLASGVVAELYLVVRGLMAAGRVKIPRHARLLQQLRVVRSTHRPGGQVSMNLPKGKAAGGGHCDLVAAMVCALSGVQVTSYQPEGETTSREREIRQEAKAKLERLKVGDDKQKEQDRQFARAFRRRLPPRMMRAFLGRER